MKAKKIVRVKPDAGFLTDVEGCSGIQGKGERDYLEPIDLGDLDIDEEGEPDHLKPAEWDIIMDGFEQDMRNITGELIRENKEMFFYAYGAACACKKDLIHMVGEIKDQHALLFINGALQACVTIARDKAEQWRQDRRERPKRVRAEKG